MRTRSIVAAALTALCLAVGGYAQARDADTAPLTSQPGRVVMQLPASDPPAWDDLEAQPIAEAKDPNAMMACFGAPNWELEYAVWRPPVNDESDLPAHC